MAWYRHCDFDKPISIGVGGSWLSSGGRWPWHVAEARSPNSTRLLSWLKFWKNFKQEHRFDSGQILHSGITTQKKWRNSKNMWVVNSDTTSSGDGYCSSAGRALYIGHRSSHVCLIISDWGPEIWSTGRSANTAASPASRCQSVELDVSRIWWVQLSARTDVCGIKGLQKFNLVVSEMLYWDNETY